MRAMQSGDKKARKETSPCAAGSRAAAPRKTGFGFLGLNAAKRAQKILCGNPSIALRAGSKVLAIITISHRAAREAISSVTHF
jgi:hypothetical protein